MKKNSTTKQKSAAKKKTTARKKNAAKSLAKTIRPAAKQQRLTVGIDVGDRASHYCIVDEAGNKMSEGSFPTTKEGLAKQFGKMAASRMALEVGTHSSWMSRQLSAAGHEVIVANAHRVKLISQSNRKNDRVDAEQLARLARIDPQMLWPIRHRGAKAEADLAIIRARAELVEARMKLINSARGLVKPLGERLKACDAEQVKESLADGLSAEAQRVVRPLLQCVERVSEQIAVCDGELAAMVERYPEVKLLTPVYGVGTLIALTYVLTLDDAQRFERSRDVGPYLGLTRKQRSSGDREPELGISKAGDRMLRSLLVQGAQCMLRRRAPESDLRGWGLKKAEGGKRAKRRAVVTVARKLAVLLHHLWVTGEVYDPLYGRKRAEGVGQSGTSGRKKANPRVA